jgi:DNA-binding transcriptional LysR family regulator
MAKAAPHLAMSQSAISEAIANLEQALRVKLLDRSPQGIAPTVYADALLKRGELVFEELRQGIRDIESLIDPSAGEIRVGCLEPFMAGLLPAVIDRFSRKHPHVVIHVVAPDVTNLQFNELRERKVDLLLVRVSGSNDPNFAVEILCEDPHFVMVGAASQWASQKNVKLADLANEPWMFVPGHVVGTVVHDAFKAHGLPVPNPRVLVVSVLFRYHLLATGHFITILPKSVFHYNATQWSLKALPIDMKVKPSSIAMVTLKHRTLSPAVERFMADIRAVVKTI